MNEVINTYTELEDFIKENNGQVTLIEVAKYFIKYGYKHSVKKMERWLNNNLIYSTCPILKCSKTEKGTIKEFIKRLNSEL